MEWATWCDEIVSGKYSIKEARVNVLTRQLFEQYVTWARQDDPRAPKLGLDLFMIHTNDSAGLESLASKIATDPGIANRDASLANQLLDRAGQLTTTNATTIAIIRSELLFQTGHPDDALATAKTALVSAQGQDAKDAAQMCFNAIQTALAQAKTNQPPVVPGANSIKQ